MKELTKAEEQVMQVIWKLNEAVLKDIVAAFPDPNTKYTTISTVVKKLVDKEFVGFKSYSRVNVYHPLISKQEYFKGYFNRMVGRFFNGSVAGFASFFSDIDELSVSDLEQINEIISDKINQKKDKHE